MLVDYFAVPTVCADNINGSRSTYITEPHICILPSPDLADLLNASLLPPLPQILQSFSPLPQVTTRTISLASVPHVSFALRFSDLAEIEAACREDDEQRAVRTIDWIGARIGKRCAKWVDDAQKAGDNDMARTPWWDELKRCAEGDHVPAKDEGWNHPVALILAVSTNAPNPLQAITTLHTRALEFPPWVDSTFIQYTLIIHPENSALSHEEAGALFNAVKKQFGLHSYLLPLSLPSPPPPPVPVPVPLPRLPPPSFESQTIVPPALASPPGSPNPLNSLSPNTLRLSEKDIQQIARFAREFVVMSLVPWMEKCVVEWNENFSSTRRLPSRLFSSTRRLFGSPSPSPAPLHNPSSSVSALPARTLSNGSAMGPGAPSQQRRLAEFATILGDYKLAVAVWEALRKEGKGGSDILPLILSPSPTLPLHASNAIAPMHPTPTSEPSSHAQLRALQIAARWESVIPSPDFLGPVLEGERWLVWAAGNAEEPPAALLLAHAALLSERKHARRRAALWYLTAANRLEKCGIKPLTMFLLRRAHKLYQHRAPMHLSPAFWESEGCTPEDVGGFDAILSGIEHPLGRLLYTTGDVAGAVRFFLGLLRGSGGSMQIARKGAGEEQSPSNDKVFLDDFRVAFAHFKSISGDSVPLQDLELPFTFCLRKQTRVRLGRTPDGVQDEWEKREEDWRTFWRARGGKEALTKSGQAAVGEMFWVDLVLRNPLDTEVNLSNLTVVVKEKSTGDSPSLSTQFVQVGVVQDLVLGANELHTVPVGVTATRPGTLIITHLHYDFLSLLSSTESLSQRGRRLQATAAQRQTATYGPDVLVTVPVVDPGHRLQADFVDDAQLLLFSGERKTMVVWFSNLGTRPVGELWMIAGEADEVWVDGDDSNDEDSDDEEDEDNEAAEVFKSENSLKPRKPFRIPIVGDAIQPGGNLEIPVTLHATGEGQRELRILFVYRENSLDSFHSAQAMRSYEVHPLLEASATAEPSHSPEQMFLVNLELENVSQADVVLTQVTTLSPTWKCTPCVKYSIATILPYQSSRLLYGANQWLEGSGSPETTKFVTRKLVDILHGRTVEVSDPPPIELICSHIIKTDDAKSIQTPTAQHFIHSGRRNTIAHHIAHTHPHIPVHSHPSIFPLYNPASVDAVVYWEMPQQKRAGHLYVSGLDLGAGHAILEEAIQEAENAKVKRSMYAETQREKMEVLDAIRNSEWNAEMNPLVAVSQESAKVVHDFTTGPCQTLVRFTIRNYSLTHRAHYVLQVTSDRTPYPPTSNLLPPPFFGRMTFRGTLDPCQITTVLPKLWITRPGSYGLSGWRLETEVCDPASSQMGKSPIRQRYLQEPKPRARACITVCDVRDT
ncbi:ER-golgi trafficking TRAPP I complex 85 kDa subunit-domain-containing protein [Infundibulicybe gibba]|nr:ER-golgi trafficking TRAPP I complex 85 kDa subunit-domain-containing protein [Infundibulicybe gibba]